MFESSIITSGCDDYDGDYDDYNGGCDDYDSDYGNHDDDHGDYVDDYLANSDVDNNGFYQYDYDDIDDLNDAKQR